VPVMGLENFGLTLTSFRRLANRKVHALVNFGTYGPDPWGSETQAHKAPALHGCSSGSADPKITSPSSGDVISRKKTAL